jgi:4-hydroxy 2-oxovalerate aldolase
MKILDCTLRDGGYYTSWNFSKKLFENYIFTVSKLNISIIELGYLSDVNDSNGVFYHLNNKILKKAKSILRKDQKIYAMINFKEIKSTKHLEKLLKDKKDVLDGVRFAVPPSEVKKFSQIIKPLSKKFKKIAFNLNIMYLSKWINDENIIKKIFQYTSNVKTVSFVDSYGALVPEQIASFFKKVKLFKNPKNKIGCHFHNNCGLALANTLLAYNTGCEILDTTFRGMGRGAGNAETELLLANLSKKNKKISGFELSNLIEIFDEMKKKMNWGSSFAYAFAAMNGFSQNQMMDLIQNKRLDPGTAVKVISNINKSRKIKFDNISNFTNLKKNSKNYPIIIGGAPSFIDYGDYFFDKINVNSPVILSGSNALFNFLKLNIKIKNPLILILSGSEIKKISILRFKNFYNKINLRGVIAEDEFLPKNIKFKKKNIIKSNSVALNPIMLAGLVFHNLKIKTLYLAFFDGNPENEKGRNVMRETQESVNKLLKLGMKVCSLTKSYLTVRHLNFW